MMFRTHAACVLAICAGLLLCAQSPNPSFPPGVFLSRGAIDKSSGGGCSQATALLARMDAAENTAAVTTAVCGMVTDGTYSKLDALYVGAINSVGNSLLNWAQNAFNLTSHGTITFTANAGWTGNGSTGYYDTGYSPGSSGAETQNSTTLGACILSTGTGGNLAEMGVSDLSIYQIINPSGTSFAMDANDATFSAFTIASVQGAWTVTRNSSSALTYYLNGSSVATPSSTSSTIPTGNVYLLAYNSGGAANFSTHQDAYFFFGPGLTGTQVTAVYNRLHTYLGAVSAPSGC